MERTLELRNISKVYPNGYRALDDISFDVGRGEIIGYLGPNGAGKTTTIKILTSLISPSSGEAYVMGNDVTKDPLSSLRHLGALIEVPGMYGYLTPKEMLAYFGRVCGMSRGTLEKRIDFVLERVSLGEWKNRRIEGFSTGMNRRLAIAKAMLHSPEVLILDEPVLGLDPRGIRDIREMIKDLSRQGMTIFLSSHLLTEVSETCDRLVFINNGKLIGIESMDEISFGSKTNRIDIELADRMDEATRSKIGSITGMKVWKENGSRMELEYAKGKEHILLAELIGSGISVRSFKPKREDLESHYMNLISGEVG